MRVLRSPAFWVSSIAILLAVLANVGDGPIHSNATMAGDQPSLAKIAKDDSLLREGAVLTEIKGRFRKHSDRFQFVEEGTNKTFKCLENLSLQRVTAGQDDDRKTIWVVTAKVTEFNDENFLILDKAVRGR